MANDLKGGVTYRPAFLFEAGNLEKIRNANFRLGSLPTSHPGVSRSLQQRKAAQKPQRLAQVLVQNQLITVKEPLIFLVLYHLNITALFLFTCLYSFPGMILGP